MAAQTVHNALIGDHRVLCDFMDNPDKDLLSRQIVTALV